MPSVGKVSRRIFTLPTSVGPWIEAKQENSSGVAESFWKARKRRRPGDKNLCGLLNSDKTNELHSGYSRPELTTVEGRVWLQVQPVHQNPPGITNEGGNVATVYLELGWFGVFFFVFFFRQRKCRKYEETWFLNTIIKYLQDLMQGWDNILMKWNKPLCMSCIPNIKNWSLSEKAIIRHGVIYFYIYITKGILKCIFFLLRLENMFYFQLCIYMSSSLIWKFPINDVKICHESEPKHLTAKSPAKNLSSHWTDFCSITGLLPKIFCKRHNVLEKI